MTVPAAKINGLRQLLERDHVVRFKTGSQVEFEDCPTCRGDGEIVEPPATPGAPKIACPRCEGAKVRLRVERPAGGISRYPFDEGGLRQAYAMAQFGPPRGPSAVTGKTYFPEDADPDRFGADPPW